MTKSLLDREMSRFRPDPDATLKEGMRARIQDQLIDSQNPVIGKNVEHLRGHVNTRNAVLSLKVQ